MKARGALLTAIAGMSVLTMFVPVEAYRTSHAVPTVEALTPETRQESIVKQRAMFQMKEEAKTVWETERNKEQTRRIANEARQIASDEKLAEQQAKKKERLKESIVENATNSINAAENKVAKKIEAIDRTVTQLEKEEKEAKSSENSEGSENYVSTGKYREYSVSRIAGRSSWKSFEFHTDANDEPTFADYSKQRKLQKKAHTGKYGIRMVGDRYCIAVGSYYCHKIGTKIDVVMASGVVLKCIMGDMKADRHTNQTHKYHVADGSYVEFIADRKAINKKALKRGSFDAVPEMAGRIAKIRVYK